MNDRAILLEDREVHLDVLDRVEERRRLSTEAAQMSQLLSSDLVAVEAHRDRVLETATKSVQVCCRDVLNLQVGLDGVDATSDIDTHGCRCQSLLHRDDGTDRGAIAPVHIGHDSHPVETGKLSNTTDLCQCALLDILRIGPHGYLSREMTELLISEVDRELAVVVGAVDRIDVVRVSHDSPFKRSEFGQVPW